MQFTLLWLFGYFCRGPIGLLIPGMITGLYYFTNRQWKTSFQIALLAFCLFNLTFALLLLMAFHTGEALFMKEVLAQQGFGRLLNDHSPRYYFFFTVGLLDYALTSIFALMIGMRYWHAIFKTTFNDSNKRFLIFLLQWSFIIILFFTLPATKKARYILPLLPAIALISAYPWILEELVIVKKRILFILNGLPLISILIAIVTLLLHQQTLANFLIMISITSLVCQHLLRKSTYKMHAVLVIALIQVMALHVTIIEPITLNSLNRISMVPWF